MEKGKGKEKEEVHFSWIREDDGAQRSHGEIYTIEKEDIMLC